MEYHLSDTKKGEVTRCSYYRGINLLCVAYNIFSNILFNNLLPYVKTTIDDYQYGYRGERSILDQIFTVSQLLDKCGEHVKDTRHLFFDFKAAYDSIDRRSLYAAMEELNIPKKLIALFKTTMKNTKCRVKMQNRLSEPITLKMELDKGMH